MRFGILGPLAVWEHGEDVQLGAGRQRALLALLLLHPNELVATDHLIDDLWPEEERPATANKVLQNYVSRLRRVLGEERLLTRSGGYLLRVEETDAGEFERAVETARGQSAADAARTLRAALELWRGRPLTDVEYESWAQPEIRRLEELRLSALEDRVEAELELGRQSLLVPELEALVAEHPLRERLCGQLILALYRSGRQADALAAYGNARRRLVDELGIEPGPALQDLQRRILQQDPELGGASRRVSPRARRTPLALLLGGAVLLLAAAAAVAVVDLTSGTRQAAAAADSLVAVAPQSDRVVAAIGVAGGPARLAAAGGRLWVGNDSAGTVAAVDLQSQSSARLVSVGGFPSDLAAADGAVWVIDGRSGQLTKIEPAYGVVARLRVAAANPTYDESRDGPDPVSVAAATRSVWVTDGSRFLTRVDAASVRIVARIDLRHPLDSVAVGLGSVWAISGPAATLYRLDERTSRPTAQIPIASSPGFQSPYPLAVAVGEGWVWVLEGNTGTVTKIDPNEQGVSATIPIGVGHGSGRLAVGDGAAWVASSDGTLSKIDPASNTVHTIALARPLADVALAGGRVWVSTRAGGTTIAAVSSATGAVHPLPASSCSPIYYRGGQPPRYLVVADLPFQGYEQAIASQADQAIQFVFRQQQFRAGRYPVAYQACDDSTAASGFFSPARCAADAHAYADDPSVIGVIGPLDSPCARVEVPIADRAPGGALAMISPTNTYVGLTRAGPDTAPHEPGRYYPSGLRNYARIIAPDDVQAAADALLAKRLGAHRVYVVNDQPGNGYGPGLATAFTLTARRLGLRVAGSGTWRFPHPRPALLAARAARLHAQAVFLGTGAIDDPQIGTLIRTLDTRAIRVIAPDAFSEFAKLVQFAGAAAQDVTVSVPGLPTSRFPQAGKKFVTAFGRAVGQTPTQYSVYTAQATLVLLDAIAHSNGTRNSVRGNLFTTKIKDGIIGNFAINKNGDTTVGAVTIYKVVNGQPQVGWVLTPRANLLGGPRH
jgi:DNA-binding SARP family transcriptional activator/ABC-type branched-subunit amino acid transport system substrate-binding protein